MLKYILFAFCVGLFVNISSAQTQANINLYPDSVHAPFIYGVASGDPTPSRVILWTALKPDSVHQLFSVQWQLATDSTFTQLVDSGHNQVDSTSGFASKIDVGGLLPNTHYCYRFGTHGVWSVTGYTLTAVDGNSDSINFAVVSCSSLFSGYFNAYRQISRLTNLNAVIHLGDFIYDFIDAQERVRLPQPDPGNPSTLNQWRSRYLLYCLDPDQREARRRHPFIQIWDNHEVRQHGSKIRERAFEEFNPLRLADPTDSTREWRKLTYGPMLDIFMIDMNTYPGADSFPSGAPMIMTAEQNQWLIDGLDTSTAKWKIISSGKMFSRWNLGNFAGILPDGLDDTWTGYPENRDSILAVIERKHINNVVVISGDLHMNISADLARNPFDSSKYNPITGEGALGVEMMGNSISRGNIDESGVPASNAPTFNKLSLDSNPHEVYTNFFDHGYVLMKFRPDSMTASMYLCPILAISDSQNLETTLLCKVDENHWVHPSRIAGIDPVQNNYTVKVYPNPSTGWIYINLPRTQPFDVELVNTLGAEVMSVHNSAAINASGLPSGMYFIRIVQGEKIYVARFVKQ